MATGESTRHRVARVQATVIDATGARKRRSERVAGEEPLEIRVAVPGGEVVATTSTMRTPGQDFALAVGLLHAEGVIAHRDDLAGIRYCTDVETQNYNVVTVDLRRPPRRLLAPRAIGSTASCGVCGTASIDDLCDWVAPIPLPSRADGGHARDDGARDDGDDTGNGNGNRGDGDTRGEPAMHDQVVDAALLASLPDRLRAAQPVFDETGGLHAAGLFDCDGRALVVHEDVGRHNALDKALGEHFLASVNGPTPQSGQQDRAARRGDGPGGAPLVAVLSGRVSFELVQKAAAARVPIICAVSAPSSLAVETADRLGVTIAGFVRDGRLTIYTHPERIATP